MCIEDVRLGRRKWSKLAINNVDPSNWTKIAGADKRRTAFRLNIQAGAQWFVWFSTTTPPFGAGLMSEPPYSPLYTIEEYGSMVTWPIWVISLSGSSPISSIEVGLEIE